MEKLIEILKDINPDIDYVNCEDLIDGHLLDSLALLSLVADMEDAFDVSIPTVEITPDNFNSAKQMMKMIERLQKREQS